MRPSFSRFAGRAGQATRRGFTLLEILIVLAILGLLVGVLMNGLNAGFGTAKTSTASLFVSSTVKLPLQNYSMTMGSYPSSEEGLKALVSPPASRADRWRGPYLDDTKAIVDPWGEPYMYRYPGVRNKNGYDVWSKGPDRQDGTADDIGNWSTDNGSK